jgi:YHS domain-containing protein
MQSKDELASLARGRVVSAFPYIARPAQDPVCGMTVDEKFAKFQIGYAGKIYYFCSARCMESFTANPTRYTN